MPSMGIECTEMPGCGLASNPKYTRPVRPQLGTMRGLRGDQWSLPSLSHAFLIKELNRKGEHKMHRARFRKV